MWRTLSLATALLIFPAMSHGQTTSNDSRTLRELLTEVQELRLDLRDLRATTATMERAEILVHRVDAQQAAVSGAFQRLETARASLVKVQDRRERLETDLKQATVAGHAFEDAAVKKTNDEAVAFLEAEIEGTSVQEDEAQAKVHEAEDQLRLEQTKLNELEKPGRETTR